jgi:hypothetical protein
VLDRRNTDGTPANDRSWRIDLRAATRTNLVRRAASQRPDRHRCASQRPSLTGSVA